MKKTQKHERQRAFTLLELMVVLAVISILAAFLLNAVFGARERAKEDYARAEAANIVTAIKMYQTEHGKWPNQSQDQNDSTYFTDNHEVIDLLRIPTPQNRHRIYLPVQESSLDSDGNYVDPWGVPYIICMDENGDRQLEISLSATIYINPFTGAEINYPELEETKVSRIGVIAGSRGGGNTIWSDMD